ncbi:MAG: 16S rRNA (adenine(1518)-N(6)/adenine(1519)-N(6))-dimethyltransferase RsmA [Candidatus Korarchaeota archaeon]
MNRSRFDQHILKKRSILEYIAGLCEPLEGKYVFEIGCGPGNLTNILISRGANVIGIELDQKFIPFLKELKEATIIIGDVARINFPLCDIIVGNIPYSVTSLILRKLSKSETKKAVLTIQLDVARRLVAEPGCREYGSLTVGMYGWNIKIAKKLSPNYFSPPPHVDSAIVILDRKNDLAREWLEVESDPQFESFLKWIFSTRKKMLRSIFPDIFPQDTRRPFMLSPLELAKLYTKLKKKQW